MRHQGRSSEETGQASRLVELNRRFVVPDESLRSSDPGSQEVFWHFAASRGLTWDEVLENRAAVIVGEAGSGKSSELKLQRERLLQKGTFSLLIKLESLFDQSVADALGSDQYAELSRWKRGSEKAIFFLDSLDEARIRSHEAIGRGLRRLFDDLGDALPRVSLILSSRISYWSSREVFEQVTDILRSALYSAAAVTEFPTEQIDGANPDATVLGIRRQRDAEGGVPVYRLLRLNRDQIVALARHFGVDRPEALYESLSHGGLEGLAHRPIDIEWLSSAWLEGVPFTSLSELVSRSIQRQLREANPAHGDSVTTRPFADRDRAAVLLAAATTLTKKPELQVPGGDVAVSGRGLALTELLPDWRETELVSLMSSGLFDEAAFGTLQFRQQLARDFIAGRWIAEAIDVGVPLEKVANILIRVVHGRYVAVPELVPVLGWVAGRNDAILHRCITSVPEVLLWFGDSRQLDWETRSEALTRFMERVHKGLRVDWIIEEADFARLATPDMASSISRLLRAFRHDEECQRYLLRLVRAGQLTQCRDAVTEVFAQPDKSERLAAHVVSALGAIADGHDAILLTTYAKYSRVPSNRVLAEIVDALFPERLSVFTLVEILRRGDREESWGQLSRSLTESIEKLDANQLTEFATALVAWIGSDASRYGPQERSGEADFSWVSRPLPGILCRLLSLAEADTVSFDLIKTAFAVLYDEHGVWQYDDDDRIGLREAIARHPNTRRQLIVRLLELSERSYLRILPGPRESVLAVDVSDWDWLAEIARASTSQPLRARAFELLFFVWRDTSLSRRLAGMTALALREERTSRLALIRNRFLGEFYRAKGRYVVPLSKKFQTFRKSRVSRQHVKWVRLGIAGIRSGTDLRRLQWLQSKMREAHSTNFYSIANTLDVVREYGHDVALALREGLKQTWRNWDPGPPSSRVGGGVPLGVTLGLAGLQALHEDGIQFGAMAAAEARRITTYGLYEINGFPGWFTPLLTSKPALVDVVVNELLAELGDFPPENAMVRTSENLQRSSAPLRAVIVPRLLNLLSEAQLPPHPRTLEQILSICGREPGQAAAFARLCQARCTSLFGAGNMSSGPAYFVGWMASDPIAAWEWFEDFANKGGLESGDVEAIAEALHTAKSLNVITDMGHAEIPRMLERMFSLFERYIPGEEDEVHTGMHSPSARERAGEFRNSIVGMLARYPGQGAHDALMRLAANPNFARIREWLTSMVERHAQRGAEHVAWNVQDVVTFARNHSREPSSADVLFEIALDRILDVKESMENGKYTNRQLLARDPSIPERNVQQWLASRLEIESRGKYRVVREEEVGEAKKPDIRLHHAKAGVVGIEIKPTAQDRYSYTDLVEALELQLAGQYLKDVESRHGILVLFLLQKRKWRPSPDEEIDFRQLVERLNQHATTIEAGEGYVKRLKVVGIDCTEDP